MKNANATQGSIPKKFQYLFWDTKFNELDLEENKHYIIARMYCKGNFDAVDWIHETYSDKDIIETAMEYRDFDPITINYLQQKYNLKREDMAYYHWMETLGGNKLWPY